jgi:glycosyltransferase involved in cell wall biosynthesis
VTRLSVVVPGHGVAPYLPACLDALLADDLPIEVIPVDDGSPDSCGDIMREYARCDPRVHPIYLSPNVGLGEARNAGLARATGRHVWFVDGDDMVAPNAVTGVLVRLAELGDPDVLVLEHALIRDERRIEFATPALRDLGLTGTVRLDECPALLHVRQAAWNRVVRRSLLDRAELKFPTGWYEDVPFSHLTLAAADSIGTLPRISYLYRKRPDGITGSCSPRHFEVFAQYERLFDALGAHSDTEGVRGELFAAMVQHYLVIVGADGRVPPELRPAFFARMVDHYHRYLPPGGYPVPPGVNGVKHRFLQWHAYGVYAAVRNVYRAGRRAQRTVVPWATAPVRAATWRAGATRSSARQPTAWRQSR